MLIPDLRACEDKLLGTNTETLLRLEAAVEARKDYRLSYDEDLVTEVGFHVPRNQVLLTGAPLRVLQEYLRAPTLNQALGKSFASTRKIESLRGLAPEIAALSAALGELRSYDGVVFRGAALPPQAIEKIKKDRLFWRDAFLSASALYMRAQYYAVNRRHGDVPVIFVIAHKRGKIIPNCLYHRNEFEVLFDRPVVFDVLKVDESRSPVHIYLNESEDAPVRSMRQHFIADLSRNSDASWNRVTGILESSPGFEDEDYIENLSSLRRNFLPRAGEQMRFDIERTVENRKVSYSWMMSLGSGAYRNGSLDASFEASLRDKLDLARDILRELVAEDALSDEELRLSLETARRSLEVVPLGFR